MAGRNDAARITRGPYQSRPSSIPTKPNVDSRPRPRPRYPPRVTPDEFERRLAQAAAHLLGLTRGLMLEAIPDDLEFAVAIQAWDDRLPLAPGDLVYGEDPRHYPEDPRRRLDAAALLAALHRDGRVPRWIDLVIVAVESGRAVVRTDVSARFTDDPAVLDNPHNEDSPFLVKAVGAPPWISRTPTRVPLERYSLTWQSDPESARRAHAARRR